MRSDDLTGLYLPEEQTTPFRQGLVVSFNVSTGNNVINVAGAELVDLPVLNIGDTVNLLPGDTVILMKMGNAWAIMGRVITVGGDTELATGTVSVSSLSNSSSSFQITESYVTRASVSLLPDSIPPWANLVTISATGFVTGRNSEAFAGFLYSRVVIEGVNSPETFVSALTQFERVQVGNTLVSSISGDLSGLTLDVSLQTKTTADTGPWDANADNVANMSALFIFTRV